MKKNYKEQLIDDVFEKYYGSAESQHIAEAVESAVHGQNESMLTHQKKMDVLKDFPDFYEFLSEEDRSNKELSRVAILKKPWMYSLAGEDLRQDESFAIEVASSPNIRYGDLSCFSDEMRSNPKVVLEIAKKDVEHAWSRQIGLDEHFNRNLEEDKYDENCIKSLETFILSKELDNSLSRKVEKSRVGRLKI